MKPWSYAIAVSATIAVGVALWRGCAREPACPVSPKADKALIETTEQLATEHSDQARAQALETMRAAEEQAIEEVRDAGGDTDLVEYLRGVTQPD